MNSLHTARRRIARLSAGFAIAALAATMPVGARAQGGVQPGADSRVPNQTQAIRLAGPRFGMTFLTQAMQDTLKNHGIDAGSVITQFGWQFEKQFLGTQGGLAAVNEWIILIGGLERGTFLPSLSWIVGLRGQGGAEVGVGPNFSASGFGLVLAAGMTYRANSMNIPLNVAVVPSNAGPRVSIITGFTLNK